jgi:hypothetical protein
MGASTSPQPEGSFPQEKTSWEPGETIPNHRGGLLRWDLDFFAPPPSEIGEVFSATSSLEKDVQPVSPRRKLRLALVCGVLLFLFVTGLLFVILPPARRTLISVLVGLAAGLAAGIVAWWHARFRHVCTYVGINGAARLVCSGTRQRLVKREVFQFPEAATLWRRETRVINQYGEYKQTNYRFDWSDGSGRLRFRIDGSYRIAPKEDPFDLHSFHFGMATETAWNRYLLGHLERELAGQDSLYFPMADGGGLSLGPGYLEFIQGDSAERWEREDFGTVSLPEGEGALLFSPKGAISVQLPAVPAGGIAAFVGGPLTTDPPGSIRVAFASLGNASFFLLALEMLVGIRVSR